MLDNFKFPKPKLYLSRRNLLTLLSKLDRAEKGEETECTLIKHKGTTPEYQQTMDAIAIIAVDDDAYYGAQNRQPGDVHPADIINMVELDMKLKENPLG